MRPAARRLNWLVALAAGLALPHGCGPQPQPGPVPPASPGLEVRGDTYRAARAVFPTHLTRHGPAAPGPAVVPPVPPGAILAGYESGGLTLRAYASPPAGRKRDHPAVLFLHGGFGFTPAHWEMTRPFRDAGYVVMIPTVRGEDGQPGTFSLFYDEVDVCAAAEVLAARPDVDPRRVFVAGHSVGGTLALLAAMASDRFRAAASFSGSPDQVEYTRNRPDRIPFDPTDPDEFRIRSPVAFPTSFRCPTRLYHGDEEFWLLRATDRTARLAQRAGLDVEAVEVAGGHDSALPRAVAESLRFFRDQPNRR